MRFAFRPLSRKGTSVFELLAALAAAQTVLFAAFLMLHTAAASRRRFEASEAAFLKTEKIRSAVRRSVRRAAAIHAICGIRVHQAGIFNIMGQDFQPGEGPSSRLPASAALSFLDLDPYLYCRSGKNTERGSGRELCCPFPIAVTGSSHTRWVAAGIDGYIEADAASTGGSEARCQSVVFSIARNPMFGASSRTDGSGENPRLTLREAEVLLDNAVVFFGVRESYTMYLSLDGSIRRVPHKSGAAQPVVDGISAFEVRMSSRRLEVGLGLPKTEEAGRFSLFLPPAGTGALVEVLL